MPSHLHHRPFHCKAEPQLLQSLVGRPLHENNFYIYHPLGISWGLGWGQREMHDAVHKPWPQAQKDSSPYHIA
jgi:hypothetical protein